MIQQASFIDFLGMLFTVFLVLVCLFWVGMLLIPFALRFLIRRHMNTMEKQLFQGSYTNHQNRNTSAGAQQKKDKKIVGEYIDFEEIE